MNSRIPSLMAALRKGHPPICIEKLRIALRTMAATEGESMILRRAKVFANVLREIPIFIEEDTLIVGNGAVLNPVGMINVADSMAAVKKLVYEDKKVAMGDLKRALDLDWKGCESLRKMCLDAPKYGNGDSYVD
jgi:pyruvate-formate lyase